MKLWIFYIIITIHICNLCHAQVDNLQAITGLPTKEVYQVLVDKKGFVWIAHELGISRYDGISFTSFSHPKQISLSLFDLFEDNEGRIWCHNLNSQIFYIENDRIILLNSYLNTGIKYYPHKALLNNEMIISASQGIYVQNTAQQKGYYIFKTIDGLDIGPTYSFSITKKNQLLIKGANTWFIYTQGLGVQTVSLNLLKANFTGSSQLIINTNKDTIYCSDKDNGTLYKFILSTRRLKLVGTQTMLGVFNGASVVGNKFWLHTTDVSITTDGTQSLKGYNITGIATDKEGNYWYSSLKRGLLCKSKNTNFKIVQARYLEKDDFIKCIINNNNYVLEGTAKGLIILKSNKYLNKYKIITLPRTRGGIENIYKLSGSQFLIVTLSNFYIFDANTGGYSLYFGANSIKSMTTRKGIAFLATNESLLIKTLNNASKPAIVSWQSLNTLFDNVVKIQDTSISFNQRVKNVCFDSVNNTLYINFISGLYAVNKTGIWKVRYNGNQINANEMVYASGKVYVGTLVNGLLIFSNNTITNLTTKDGLSSNTIIKMRLCNKHLWLLSSGIVQVFDIEKQKIADNISLPPLFGSFVYDVAEINNQAFLTTNEGMYSISLNEFYVMQKPLNYLYSIVANLRDTLSIQANQILDDNTKSLAFSVVSLWYNNPQNVYFKYRLIGVGNDVWQTATPSQKTFSFTGLSAGKYQFQAVAINGFGIAAANPIIYTFSIKKPWWQQWWLYLIIAAIVVDIFYIIIQQRINIIKKRNELLVDKIQLQGEVRNSMLTAIKSQMNPHFIFNALNTIQSFIYSNNKSKANSYLGKFSNLIRIVLDSSNKKVISLAEEIEMLQLYVDLEEMRFENTLQVSINVHPSLDIDAIYIPPMLIQPFVENAIKHGLLHKIDNRRLAITFKPDTTNQLLEIDIDDNGIGRSKSAELNAQQNSEHNSFAMQANQTRIDILNQLSENQIILTIIDKKDAVGIALGTTVRLIIPKELLV